jgi:hypothetical protein
MSEEKVPDLVKESLANIGDGEVAVQDKHGPEDVAAAFFQREKPRLKGLLSNMSSKQIRRFVMHVVSYPMCDAGDMPVTDNEKRAAYLFAEMMTNKTIMQLTLEMQKVDEAQKIEDTKTDEQGVVENG